MPTAIVVPGNSVESSRDTDKANAEIVAAIEVWIGIAVLESATMLHFIHLCDSHMNTRLRFYNPL